MFPPCEPGGTECGRSSPETATPIVPRKGESGKAITRSPSSTTGSSPTRRPSRSSTGVNTLT